MKKGYFKKGIAMVTACALVTAFATLPANVVQATGSDDSASGTVTWCTEDSSMTVKLSENSDCIYYATTSASSKIKIPSESKFDYVEDNNLGDGDARVGYIQLDMSSISTSNLYLFYSESAEDIVAATAKDASDADKAKIKVAKVNKMPTLAGKFFGTFDEKSKMGKAKVTTDSAIAVSEGFLAFTVSTGSAVAVTEEQLSMLSCNRDATSPMYGIKGGTFAFQYTPASVTTEFSNAATSVDKIVTLERASKTVNVKIPAKGTAPSVKVDYKTDKITIPAGVEYIVKSVGTIKNTSNVWIRNTSKKTVQLPITQLVFNGSTVGKQSEAKKGIVVKARKAATTTAKASKEKVVNIFEEKATDQATLQKDTTVSVVSDGALNISYKKVYDRTSGIQLTNYTQDNYQVALVSKSLLKGTINNGILDKTSDIDWSKISWTTVKPVSKSEKPGSGTIAYSKYYDKKSAKFKADDYVLLYRNVKDGKFTVRSEIKAVDFNETTMPALKQTMSLTPDGKPAVDISSGSAIQSYTVTATGGAIGSVTIDKPTKAATSKYTATVNAYTTQDCTTKSTALKLNVVKAADKVTISTKSGSTAGTYYVQIIIEGCVGVIKVEVK